MNPDTTVMGDKVRFAQTRWDLVRTASRPESLEALIQIYWKPLYFFVRQKGMDVETSKDQIQGFFTSLMERHAIERADPRRGRFRTFLLASLTNYLRDRRKEETTQKRGGGQALRSLDFRAGEEELALQVAGGEGAEAILDRAWARALWEGSLREVEGEPLHLEALRLYVEGRGYAAITAKTGLSESAAKTAIHRLKHRVREILLARLRETCGSGDDVGAEIGEFLRLLS